ncbi:MAG TPA: response regulator, partial [Phycisphaerales bacterium]|nr:response regulator [Phycisphaerales bacterium]
MVKDSDKPLAVLIVEDEPVNAAFLRGIVGKLAEVGRIETVSSLREAHDRLGERFDVVLLDLNLPDSAGLDTLMSVTNDWPQVAVVVVTGEHDEQTGLRTLVEGAQEYLVKGKYDAYILHKSIRYAVERKRTEVSQKRLLKELEGVNQELQDFAYIISHDLKAPLRGISSLAQWIAEDYADKLGDEGKEHLDLLLSRVERMHALIDGVLQYSRVGRICEEQVDVDLNELLAEAADMVAAPEHIRIGIAEGLPTVHAERTRLLQVFQNLLSNAVKY